jgi:hypothetical protein
MLKPLVNQSHPSSYRPKQFDCFYDVIKLNHPWLFSARHTLSSSLYTGLRPFDSSMVKLPPGATTTLLAGILACLGGMCGRNICRLKSRQIKVM